MVFTSTQGIKSLFLTVVVSVVARNKKKREKRRGEKECHIYFAASFSLGEWTRAAESRRTECRTRYFIDILRDELEEEEEDDDDDYYCRASYEGLLIHPRQTPSGAKEMERVHLSAILFLPSVRCFFFFTLFFFP